MVHFHVGGSPDHDLVVALGNGLELTVDVAGVAVEAGDVDIDLDLGLRQPDPDAEQDPQLLNANVLLADAVEYLKALEDAISDAVSYTHLTLPTN